MKYLKGTVKSIVTAKPLAPLGKPSLRLVQYALACHNRFVVRYDNAQRARAMEIIADVLDADQPVMSPDEAYMLYATVERTAKIPGDLAEVGVFQGRSARLICEAKGDRELHLFDTFEGLPRPGEHDDSFQEGQYACSLDAVREYLHSHSGVRFYKGYFPATAGPASQCSFSFVHLDVDLWESTHSALEFFYPRMNSGGVILSHDYVQFPGVRKAFDEFFENKPEPVLELGGNQCLVVKTTTSN